MLVEQDPFSTIDLAALDSVTGGRIEQSPKQKNDALVQGIGQLAQALQGVGQNLAQAKASGDSQMMQMMQQMAQSKGGGGGGGGKPA